MNNATNTDDSFWIKIDDGEFEGVNDLLTTGWEWLNLASQKVFKGNHTLTIAFREDGAKLDKIAISNFEELPTGMGQEALNVCLASNIESSKEVPTGFSLNQNYPNPFNPSTNIEFNIPDASQVSLKVFNSLGQEVATLVNTKLASGTHSAIWDASATPSGVYFYRLKAGEFVLSKQMLLIK